MGNLFSSDENAEEEAEEKEGQKKDSHEPPTAAGPQPQPEPDFKRVLPKAKLLVDKMIDDANRFLTRNEEAKFVHDYFRRLENDPIDDRLLWTRHPELSQGIYLILIDWLASLHAVFSKRSEVIYLTVSLIVRYMISADQNAVPMNKFQCLGVAAMRIACKYEENKYTTPTLHYFVEATDSSCSGAAIVAFENVLLHTINFRVSTPPTMYPFVCWYAEGLTAPQRKKAFSLFEMSLLSANLMASFRPSEVAAAATCIAIQKEWPERLRRFSGYARKDLDMAIVAILAFSRFLRPNREMLFVVQKFS